MSKTLAERHENLRQSCIRIARHMKLIASQDRKEAQFAEPKALKDFWESNARYLEEEAELLTKAAEEV